ncbi:MAG: hypothetical protein LBG74_02480, partial [Spirochaetaceae bacterium]|nr:hypothetical protein [Spirochaetaceae bacterium]
SILSTIEQRKTWCESNGIQFLILIAPNKHNIYPEYYPLERPAGITRTEQILAALPDNIKETVIYPLDDIISKKDAAFPLYFETDTHWNMAGAKCAFDVLFLRIQKLFSHIEFPRPEWMLEINYDTEGDIPPMSGFASYGKRTVPVLRPQAGWDAYYRYINENLNGHNDINGIITENTDAALPRAIIYRDSFFIALEPFTGTLFSRAEYIWRGFTPMEYEYILEQKPDIVIWEMVERSSAGKLGERF